ncbi:MAG: antibiotic biosynthesis monooxygenase family protein [Calditrichia bacterium]
MRQHVTLLAIGLFVVLTLQLGCTNTKTSTDNPTEKNMKNEQQKQNPVVLINLFEVPAENEDGFVEGWKAAADYLREQEGFVSTALRQSIDPTARFQYINIAVWNSPKDFKTATSSEAFQPIRLELKETKAQGTPSLFQIIPIPEKKAPAEFHAQYLAEDIVFLINPFKDIPADADDKFISGWHAAELYLKKQKGYIDTALHQSISETAFRFINVAVWASAKDFQTAVSNEEFRQIGGKIPYTAYPSLYKVIAQ